VGARVADTIRTKIVDVDLFENDPALLMLGMTCAVVASSLYLTLATRLGMPVSTTHSIMGGVIGMGIAAVGADGIQLWGGNVNSGVVQVFLAWVFAPLIAGGFGSVIFLITKHGVMLRKDPVMRAFVTIPIYFGITSALLTSRCTRESDRDFKTTLTQILVLIVWKGGSSRISLTNGETVGTILGVGAGVALLVTIFFLPWLYQRLIKGHWQLRWYHIFMGPLLLKRGDAPPPPEGYTGVKDYYAGHMTMEQLQAYRASQKDKASDVEKDSMPVPGSKENGINASDESVHTDGHATASSGTAEAPTKSSIIGPRPVGAPFSPAVLFWQFKRVAFHGVDQDIIDLQKKRSILTGDLETIHAHAKHYDNRAEYMYSFLQVMTAATASFTHGANDVAKYVDTLFLLSKPLTPVY
jgi:phosphate/sulfate permease